MERGSSLSRDTWVAEGLSVLAREGHGALRAEPLAKRLKVSRGIFYWHFADVPAFHDAVLERWQDVAVDRPLAAATASGDGEEADLGRLIAIAFAAPVELERAVHAWAMSDQGAAHAVGAVNHRRVALLGKMFRASGLGHAEAAASAAILYWAYLGRLQFPEPKTTDALLEQIVRRLGPGTAEAIPARPRSDRSARRRSREG